MNPKQTLEAVVALQRQIRQARETYAKLLGESEMGKTMAGVASNYEGCKPRLTEDEVQKIRIGPLDSKKRILTNDALEGLLAMCGGMRAALNRLERPEVAGAGVAPWEEGD